MVKYNQSFIYKLCCRDPTVTDIYVGSTTNMPRRKQQHKTTCCNKNSKDHNSYVYQFIRNNQGWTNWNMEIIEHYPCENSVEACKRDQYWINTEQATLNVVIDFDKNVLKKLSKDLF